MTHIPNSIQSVNKQGAMLTNRTHREYMTAQSNILIFILKEKTGFKKKR